MAVMLRISVPFRISFWYFLTFVSTLPFTHEIPLHYSIVSTITLHVTSRFSIPFMFVSLHNTAKVPPYYWTLSTRLEKSFQITKQSPYFWAYISRVLRWYNHLQLVFIFEFIVVYFSYSSYFVRKNS